jgi:transcriptional regulator with XRE-family HTH domain
MKEDFNRIKVVFVEKEENRKWLAKQVVNALTTVSKWCTNSSEPSLPTLTKNSNILDVAIKQLVNSSKTTADLFCYYTLPIIIVN